MSYVRAARNRLLTAAMPICLALTSLLSAGETAATELPDDQRPIECGSCAGWNAGQAPFRLHGQSWYVGVRGLSTVLIDTGAGLVLIDGGLPQSAAPIIANIEALGFAIAEVKWILNSHAHFDHAGGIAALVRISGAQVLASPDGAAGLRAGAALEGDPQAAYGEEMRFPPVADVQEIADREPLTLGGLTLTPHFTPGHMPGGTTWTWRACEADRCLSMVYADSLNAVSAPGFAFSGEDGRPAKRLRDSIDRVRALDCDILVPAHPDFGGLYERLERGQAAGAAHPLVDRDACRVYAGTAETRLAARLEQERSAAATDSGAH
jgi:metallo-beta-lactamase class B